MPGICALASRTTPHHSSAMIARMLDSMRHHDWYVDSRYSDESTGVALGRMSLGYVNTAPQPATSRDGKLILVMDGELYDVQAVARSLGLSPEQVDHQNHARLLLEGITRDGNEFLRTLHGSFVAGMWDAAAKQLVIFNDRFATKPIYYTRSPQHFLAASSIAAIMTDEGVSRDLSPRGLAQFFTYGHYLANDTLYESIQVLPAATRLTYDTEKGSIELEAYWSQLDDLKTTPSDPRKLFEQIDIALHQAVERRSRQTPHLGLSLSGGLDARTILGVMDHGQTDVQTICLGMSGSRDHRCSQQMADIVGCRHHNHTLDEHFLDNFVQHMQRMVKLTDGQYLSQCIVMPTLPMYRDLGVQALLRGHAGELLHMQKAYNYSLDKEAMAIDSDQALENWLARHLQAYMLDGVEKPLFQAKYQSGLNRFAQESLHDCIEPLRGVDPPLQRVWHLFISQRLRRETMMSMVKFNSVVEPRMPYLDNDLVSLLLSTPPSLKLAEEIQTYILRKRRPEFLDVVNTNTGARLGAGLLARNWATLTQKVLGKLGAPGYQPYERIGLWLRRELKPFVEQVLLSDECLDRGVFDPDGLRAAIANHLSNRHNHTYLILASMIFELGQRTFTSNHEPV